MKFDPKPFSSLYAYNYLVQRKAGNDVDRLGHTLYSSKIKLTPHQIQAALYAFKSPITKGVVLADEVGLGKTIEAGIVLAQLWFERKRKILIVTPASLMKQWQNELRDKFALPSMIMDGKAFTALAKKGYSNPFACQSEIIICSYQTCSRYKDFIVTAGLDFVVVDEAHKLRNVHNEKAVTAGNIKFAIGGYKKLLLTATPIQNSLLDLYGLASVLDESLFGDKGAFRQNYIRDYEENFADLKERLDLFMHRTLRSQVVQYINYTNRIPKTYTFKHTPAEKCVYAAVQELLINADSLKFIIPPGHQHLLLLILCKLMGSSVHSIVSTLTTILDRLIKIKETHTVDEIEPLDIFDYEFDDEEVENSDSVDVCEEIDYESLDNEIAFLTKVLEDAKEVDVESKYIALQNALLYAFQHLTELGAEEKVIIFTESKRTQEYLYDSLIRDGYEGVLVYNGTNTDEQSRAIYNEWLSKPCNAEKAGGSRAVNMREAIIDKFKADGRILIATEAGAEGLNLQFCSLIINYDLPWNPQRVEQRIGRCHRFGQKYDVVVINFINEDNAVEQRIYELLSQKFKLFDEVFGVSDSILGTLEDGKDIAKSIIDIYTQCRSTEEINAAFDELQSQFRDDIDKAIEQTKTDLLEFFDEDLQSYFADILTSAEKTINEVEKMFWRLTKSILNSQARFNDAAWTFVLNETDSNVEYALKTPTETQMPYSTQSELGRAVMECASQISDAEGRVLFDISNYPYNISTVEALKGKTGYLVLKKLTIQSYETEELLVLHGVLSDGTPLDTDICEKLFRLSTCETVCELPQDDALGILEKNSSLIEEGMLRASSERNNKHLQEQIKSINKWADDKIQGTQLAVEAMREQRKELQKLADEADNIQLREELEEKILRLSRKIKQSWLDLAMAEEEIEDQRHKMIQQLRRESSKGHYCEQIMLIQFEVI